MFANKVAVITGAASGIGKALAEKAAALNMRLVLADINEAKLMSFAQELSACGGQIKAIGMDVSQRSDWQRLLTETLQSYDAINIFFNNAAIGGPTGKIWEIAAEKYEQLLNINLLGTLYGVQTFVPQLLQQSSESHIVITAAMSGFFTYPYFSAYQVSKHAVIALAECLYHELKETSSHIHPAVLCPGFVQTDIFNHALQTQMDDVQDMDLIKPIKNLYKRVKHGMSSQTIAEIAFKGITEKQFYIMTHPEMQDFAKERFEAVLNRKNPARFDIEIKIA